MDLPVPFVWTCSVARLADPDMEGTHPNRLASRTDVSLTSKNDEHQQLPVRGGENRG
jgi:hypothetical protein